MLLQIKEWGPDVFLNLGVGAQFYIMSEQAYDVGLFPTVPMVSDYQAVRPEYWKNMEEKGNYLVFLSYHHPSIPLSDIGERCKAAYWKEYAEEPQYSVFNPFGQIHVIAQAIEQAGSADPVEIKEALMTGTFTSYTPRQIKFVEGEGVNWHQFSLALILVQYQEPSQEYEDASIIFPEDAKTGDFISP